MKHFLKIYIDRLLGGEVEVIEERVCPNALSLEEKDLRFNASVLLLGKAYLAKNYLIIELKIETIAQIPCTICSEMVEETISIPSFSHIECIANIKGQVYHYANRIREAILLEVPFYVECMGSCPKRVELKNYIKEKDAQFPFSDL